MAECEGSYGFLPCSTLVSGNLFLLAVYGYLMLKAAQILSDGCEMLLAVLDPGTIGGLVLPILGALPDAMLILVSGLGGSRAAAQSQVSVGMGLLAGSTIMLLTLLWGSSLVAGRCDLQPVASGHLVARDGTLTKGLSLTGCGVSTDWQTRMGAWIMIGSLCPYIVAQLPHMLRHPSYARPFSTIACLLALGGLLAYCAYQVMSPWIQQRMIRLARLRFRRSHALHRVSLYSSEQSWGNLLLEDGVTPNTELIERIFGYFDENKDGHLAEKELKGFIVGLGINCEGHLPEEQEVKSWLAEFDTSRDDRVSQEEFVAVISDWLKNLRSHRKGPVATADHWHGTVKEARTSLETLLMDQVGGGGQEDEEEAEVAGGGGSLTRSQVILRALLQVLAGAALAGLVADPLVDTIDNFSKASSIPSFFIAFVATPLATNSSEAVSSLMFAATKRRRNIAMTYSQIYGAVTMNNTLCLGVFLAIVACRGLTWDFSAEVLIICLVVLLVGLVGGTTTTLRLWTALPVLLLYPLSVCLVGLFDYRLGWH